MNSLVKKISTAAILGISAQIAFSGSAFAAADLEVTKFKLLSKPAVGKCNTVSMTVKNIGNQSSGRTKGAIVTYPAGNAFQQRAERRIYIAPLRPGQSRTLTVSKIEILPLGAVRIQSAVNAPQNFPEDDYNNNSGLVNAQVVNNCELGGTNDQANNACDLELTFSEPAGNTIPANGATSFLVKARNLGAGQCPKRSVRLYRYNGNTASGYGSAVGGTSGSIRQIPALSANQTADLEWVVNPGAPGAYTFASKITTAHNDGNNSNHRPKKTVVAQ